MHGTVPSLDNFNRRHLDELERLTVHPELAVVAALDYCAQEKIAPPTWVVERAAVLICNLIKREKTHKRGRHAGIIARYRQDMWDIERWDAVEEMRRIKKKNRDDLAQLRSHGKKYVGTHYWTHAQRFVEWFRNGIYECAARTLVGRDARASAATMRASHRRCVHRSAGWTRPDRYHLFDEDFLVKLGFPRLIDRKPGTKFICFYHLQK
jgi:hypothetical protein